MEILSPDKVYGDMIQMKRTDSRHLDETGAVPKQEPQAGTGFSAAFTRALQGVSDMQIKSADLAEQMVINPESVDPHDVTIAMAKANTSLQMTKSILDSALKAYREIINIR
jgi:flagellar hook-basal body complex protein FliE